MNPDPTSFPLDWRSYSFAPYFLSVAFNSICRHDPDDPIKSVEIGTADSMAKAEIKTVKGRVYFLKNNPIYDPNTGKRGSRTFLVLKDTPFTEDVFTVRAW